MVERRYLTRPKVGGSIPFSRTMCQDAACSMDSELPGAAPRVMASGTTGSSPVESSMMHPMDSELPGAAPRVMASGTTGSSPVESATFHRSLRVQVTSTMTAPPMATINNTPQSEPLPPA